MAVKKKAPPAAPKKPVAEKIMFDEPEAHLVSMNMKPGKEGHGPTVRLVFDMPARNDGGKLMNALRRLNKEACVLRVVMPQLEIPQGKVKNDAPHGSDAGTMFEGGAQDENGELPL